MLNKLQVLQSDTYKERACKQKKGWNENPPVNAPTSYEKKYKVLITCQNVIRMVLKEYIQSLNSKGGFWGNNLSFWANKNPRLIK